VSPLISGLAGVVVGGFLTFGLSYALERRRERRAIRGAARLVQQEFVDGMISAGRMHLYQNNQPVDREKIAIEDHVWLEHRWALAEALDGDGLSELTWAAKGRREFIDWLEQKRKNDEPVFNDDYAKLMYSNLVYSGNRGWDALAKAAGISWRERRKWRREHERREEQDAKDPAPQG
jgi:hypothetical protein